MVRRRDLTLCYFVILFHLLVFHIDSLVGYQNCPYGHRCLYEPAPRGRTPYCATPGLTYCIDLDTYPSDVIRRLIDSGSYDINTLLTDESTDDFKATAWKKYGSPYDYGPNSLPSVDHISLVEEPLYLQPPQHNNVYNQDFFNQKTPLQPPSPDVNYRFRKTNYTYNSNMFKFLKENGFSPNLFDYYNNYGKDGNLFNNHVINPNYNLPSNGWSRFSISDVTPYNPLEWWRYMNPNSRSDVTIEKSVAFPPRTTVYYPKNNKKIKKRSIPVDVAGKEALLKALKANRDEISDRFKRQSDINSQDDDVEQLCDIRTQYVTPRAALNKEGRWKYIVNMEENMTQLVRAEICISSECNGICSLPLGYKSRCEQKYVQKRLVALESDGGRLYTDIFWIPSCCQCTISRNNN